MGNTSFKRIYEVKYEYIREQQRWLSSPLKFSKQTNNDKTYYYYYIPYYGDDYSYDYILLSLS